jgi:hypothetical protein
MYPTALNGLNFVGRRDWTSPGISPRVYFRRKIRFRSIASLSIYYDPTSIGQKIKFLTSEPLVYYKYHVPQKRLSGVERISYQERQETHGYVCLHCASGCKMSATDDTEPLTPDFRGAISKQSSSVL